MSWRDRDDVKSLEEIYMKHGIDYFPGYVDVGWHDIVDRMLAELMQIPGARVDQIKEKFGTGRFYVGVASCEDAELLTKACAIADKYEQETYTTCEVCGALGERRYGGWIKTLCDEHAKDRK